MKKVVSILSIIAVLTMLMPLSMAASFKFTPEISATRVEAGDTVTINLKISDIDVGEKGINTLKCKFLYDTDVFENVTMTSKNNWSINYNNKEGNTDYGTLLAVLIATGVTDDQEVGTITLHVKAGAKGKTGEITFTTVSTNDGQTEIKETDKVITVTVNGTPDGGDGTGEGGNGNGNGQAGGSGSGNTQQGGTNGQGSGTTQGGNGSGTENGSSQNGSSQNGKNTQNGKDNTQSKGKLPNTGVDSTIILICIAICVIALIIGYVQFKKNEDIK